MRAFVFSMLVPAMLAACAAERAEPEPVATAATAGPARNCINPRLIAGRRAAGRQALIFEVGGATYRNDLPAPCPGLERAGAADISQFDIDDSAELCRNDSFRVFDPVEAKAVGTRAFALCRLGAFTPVAGR